MVGADTTVAEIEGVGDAVVGGLLGYRATTMRTVDTRESLATGFGFAFAMAIAAGLLRALALPRLVGPAILTLLFFLWESLVSTSPGTKRSRRFTVPPLSIKSSCFAAMRAVQPSCDGA